MAQSLPEAVSDLVPMAPTGPVDAPKMHDVTVVKRKKYGCAKVEAVPPEEFGVAKRTRSMRDCTYAYHEVKKTRAELVDQGYDEDQLNRLQGVGETDRDEARARDTVEEQSGTTADLNKASVQIRVTEHYIVMAYEEDEKARLYRVVTGGEESEVLTRDGKADIEPVDMMPFAVITPVIVTHRFWGRSMADIVMDIQREKTALKRAMLDNLYLLNNQRVEVAESHAGERTIDDLLVNRPGGVIRTKQPGGIIPIPNQPIGQFILPSLEYLDAQREWRTGVTRQGQGLDANALQNQSATAVNQAFNASQARVKLIARIFAETGIKDLFWLLHATIRKNDRAQNTVRLRNKWVTIDPRNWKTRDDITSEVGLGGGTKQERMGFLMQVLQVQREAIQVPQLKLTTPKKIYNTLDKLCQLTDLKSAEQFFHDPDQPIMGPDGQPMPEPEPPPDPKMIEVQGKLEAQKAEMAGKFQMEQAKGQADQQTNQAKAAAELQMQRERMQMEMQLAEQKMVHEFELKNQQMQAEFALKREEMMLEASLKREANHLAARNEADANAATSVGDTKLGGEVG
jgi:hypothetical protein